MTAEAVLNAAEDKVALQTDATLRDAAEMLMLREEFEHLGVGASVSDVKNLLELRQAVGKLSKPLAALCLSGGGIRSASFALGILQGLAKYKLLSEFNYLSTVSGGGYIGSWLSALRHHVKNDRVVFEALGGRSEDAILGREVPQVEHLRKYSNFLTPKLGALSGDTWTLASLYVRNLLLNWTIFFPLLVTIVSLPIFVTDFHLWIESLFLARGRDIFQNVPAMIAAAFASLLLTGVLSVILVESTARQADREITDQRFRWRVLYPAYVSGFLFIMVAILTSPPWYLAAIAGMGMYLLSAATTTVARLSWAMSRRIISWLIAGAVFGALGSVGIGLWDTYEHGVVIAGITFSADVMLTTFGITWFMLSVVLAETVYIGLSSYARDGDAEREWLARSSGMLLAVAIGWMLLSLVALMGPVVMEAMSTTAATGLLGAGAAAGAGSAWVGRSAVTKVFPAAKNAVGKLPKDWVLPALAGIFIVALGVAVALGVKKVLQLLPPNLPSIHVLASFLVVAVSWALAYLASSFININRFSPHALYRNRLIRAFIGGARPSERRADPFTGFDEADNLAMHELAPMAKAGKDSAGLFHVVNTALNVVNTSNLAWQQRKAETFTITPLHCGNPNVGYRPSREYGHEISLGTAVTISGAAASPNMGYHSSSLISFVMMLFNVRLGWWLGNPKSEKDWKESGPRSSFLLLIKEMLGRTSSEDKHIYLSDGGHFENLALYEMIRRRCKFIVVSDAGCDPTCTLEDLGNAVRKIKIDFGVDIVFQKITARARSAPQDPGGRFCAIAHIHYPEDGGAPAAAGKLIYFKPGLYGDLSPSITSYGSLSKEFPHESTADQFFSESQMESYRALGLEAVDCLFKDSDVTGETGLNQLYARAQRYVGRPH